MKPTIKHAGGYDPRKGSAHPDNQDPTLPPRKLYEVVNPSDHVILAAFDDLTAAVATLLLGQGAYGLRDAAGNAVLPLFLLGGAEEWLADKGIADLAAWVTDHRLELVAIYESAFYGTPTEYTALQLALADMPPDQRLAAVRRYNDEKRSSMNDIGAACAHWANHLRKMAP